MNRLNDRDIGEAMSDNQPNPLTKLFPLAIGGFGWQVHGLLIGIILAVAYVVIAIASNMQVIANTSDDDEWVNRIQSRKWIIFLLFMVGIAVSGAEIISF
jgi:hypothetical protein